MKRSGKKEDVLKKSNSRMRSKKTNRKDMRVSGLAGSGRCDYGIWHFSGREWLACILIYLLLDGVVSLLFFRSAAALFLFLPGLFWFFRDRKKEWIRKRYRRMREEFLTAMQLAGTALSAGYSAENAFREAERELKKIYPADSFICTEISSITAGVRLNQRLEDLLLDLGSRSHLDEIVSFAEVFSAARKTGGDLITIVGNTVQSMQQKEETRREIETIVSGRKMEQQIMSVIPLFILAYVNVTSPDFLQVMYHNLTGVLIMSACLCVYFAAWMWGRSIMEIEV